MILIVKIKLLDNYTVFRTQGTQVFRELWIELERDFIVKDGQEMLEFSLRVFLYGK